MTTLATFMNFGGGQKYTGIFEEMKVGYSFGNESKKIMYDCYNVHNRL